MPNQAERNAAQVKRFLQWRETQETPRATLISFRVYLTKWVAWAGDRPLAELTLGDLDDFVLDCYGHLGYSSKKAAVTALRAFYRWGVKRKHLPVNVAVELELPRKPRRERPTYYQPEQVAAILSQLDHTDRLITLLLVRHGQRITATTSLRWGDIDWKAGVVRYPPTKQQLDGLRLPLDKDTATQLKAWQALTRNTGPEAWVFPAHLHPSRHRCTDNYRASLQWACKRAGVPYRGAHELRRTAITTLLKMGVPLHVVSKQYAGHSHVSTTVEHYAGPDDDSLADAIAALPF